MYGGKREYNSDYDHKYKYKYKHVYIKQKNITVMYTQLLHNFYLRVQLYP